MELQQFFIRIRDELCKNGEILMSPALSFSSKHLHSDVEKDKKQKLPKEFEEDKIKREEEKRGILLYIYSSSVYITAVDSLAIVHVCNLLLVNML